MRFHIPDSKPCQIKLQEAATPLMDYLNSCYHGVIAQVTNDDVILFHYDSKMHMPHPDVDCQVNRSIQTFFKHKKEK